MLAPDPSAPTVEVLRFAGAAFGTLLTVPVVVFLWRIAGDWRSQGDSIRDMHGDVKALMDPEKGVLPRIAKQEYILTGDGGTNGVRGDVKRLQQTVEEVQTAQRNQNDSLHAALGKREVAERRINDRLAALEKTQKTPKRRRSA